MHYTSVLLAGLSLRHYVYAAPSPLAALPLLNTVDTTIGQAGSTVKSATNSVTNLLGSDLVSKRAGLDLETVPTLVDSVVDAPLSIPGHGIGGIALFPKKTLASALKKYAGLETKVFGQVDAIAGIVAKDVSKGCVPAVQVALNSIIASLQGFISLDLNVPVVGLVVSDVNVILDLTNVVDLVVKDVVGCVETLKVSLAADVFASLDGEVKVILSLLEPLIKPIGAYATVKVDADVDVDASIALDAGISVSADVAVDVAVDVDVAVEADVTVDLNVDANVKVKTIAAICAKVQVIVKNCTSVVSTALNPVSGLLAGVLPGVLPGVLGSIL